MQLAWSHDNTRFLVLGNGKQSSVMIYDVCKDIDSSEFKLQQSWNLRAEGSPSPPDVNTSRDCADKNNDVIQEQETSVAGQIGAPTSSSIDSGRNYPYEEAFFMAEFNPTGKVFAVKEVPYVTTILYLISLDGCIEKMADLMALMGKRDCCKRPVNTIFISAHHNGVYAIGVEGGYIALVDAELLQLNKVFKVVGPRYRELVCLGLFHCTLLIITYNVMLKVTYHGEEKSGRKMEPTQKRYPDSLLGVNYFVALGQQTFAILGVHILVVLLCIYWFLCAFCPQGSGFRTGIWDGEYLVVHSDSGKVMWWDREGEKVLEFATGFSDIVVHMDWSLSGRGLWVCGFSCLDYCAVERSTDEKGWLNAIITVVMRKVG